MRTALLAFLLGLAIPAFTAGPRAVQCVIIALSGKVAVLRAGDKVQVPAKKGDFIYEGDEIITAKGGLASVALTGGAEVRVNADSTLKFGSSAGEAQKTEMKSGQIWSRLLHGHAQLHVNTGNAVAAVRGTEADIKMRGELTVKVYEGVVDVINAFGKTTLNQGQTTKVTGPDAAPALPQPMAPTDSETWQKGISADDKTKNDLLKKLDDEAAKAPEKTLKLKVEQDGKQKTIRIKFKKGE